MPRDLESEKATLEGMPALTKEPEGGAPPVTDDGQLLKAESKRDQLHPYVQTLNPTDLESCVSLENACFPPNEAASRDKFIYRLTVCGELCLGLFASLTDRSPPLLRRASTASTGSLPETGSSRTSVLLAHAISTKSANETITDDDMALPPRWAEDPHADPQLGHKEEGRTLCLHSLAVLPEYQRAGLGATLVKSYLQRMQGAEVADRVALLAHEDLVPFYEKLGFKNRGKSPATYGGGGWFDLVYEFKDAPPSPSMMGFG